MLFITHNLGVVACVADVVLVLDRGRICESGPVGRVLTDPSDDYTRRLLAAAPSLPHGALS
jgi:peptide/nickel transport system ATP-binding protein